MGNKSRGLILLVDDEPILRLLGECQLQEFGYNVLLAENGREAINIYQNNLDTIDLVLLDMMMPVMNGRDCFISLRAIKKDLPIVIVSGYSDLDDVKEVKALGCNGFLKKPYTIDELSKIISQTIK